MISLMVLAVAAQISLLPTLRPLGVVPNLVLVMMVLVAVAMPTSEALIIAVVSGLILDLASGEHFGLWMGVMILITLVAGMLHRTGVELDRTWVALALVSGGTVCMSVAIWFGLAKFFSGPHLIGLAGRMSLELVLNLGLTVVFIPLAQWLLRGGRRQSEVGVFE